MHGSNRVNSRFGTGSVEQEEGRVMGISFTSAIDALERSGDSPDELAAPFVAVFPVSGASISTGCE